MTAEEWARELAWTLSGTTFYGHDDFIHKVRAIATKTIVKAQEQGRAEERERAARIADGYTDMKPVSGEHAPIVATVMNDTAEKIAAANATRPPMTEHDARDAQTLTVKKQACDCIAVISHVPMHLNDLANLEERITAALREAADAAYEDCARYHEELAEGCKVGAQWHEGRPINGPALAYDAHQRHAANLRERGKSNAG